MTMKNAVCVLAVSLVASTAFLSVPASAKDVRISVTQSQANKMIRHAAKRGFEAGYQAGLRRNGSAYVRAAYNRGYSDAMNRLAYNPGGSVANSYARYPVNIGSNGYSSYARYNGDYRDSYARYTGDVDGRRYSASGRYYGNYGETNAYSTHARYDAGFNPIGALLNVVFAPFAAMAAQNDQNDRWAYCSARYRSFDPASGTYLAYDGSRYYCS